VFTIRLARQRTFASFVTATTSAASAPTTATPTTARTLLVFTGPRRGVRISTVAIGSVSIGSVA